MNSWKRGDIFYVESTANTETQSSRPAVIVSSEKVNDGQLVEIVYLTLNPKQDLSTHIDISSMQRTSVALCEQIRTIHESRLGDYLGHCTSYEMQMIDIALAIGLDLDFSENATKSNDNTNSEKVAIPKESVMKTAESVIKPAESDMEMSETVIKLTAERDTYKQLYENLLERMMQ